MAAGLLNELLSGTYIFAVFDAIVVREQLLLIGWHVSTTGNNANLSQLLDGLVPDVLRGCNAEDFRDSLVHIPTAAGEFLEGTREHGQNFGQKLGLLWEGREKDASWAVLVPYLLRRKMGVEPNL